ncbi:EFR1 family ferrodoxin [Senegalia sp. (in: firmicutes)]|uniref:EFR1 family ferrodoxin n=1 Tax=Senegalia sp. (in: firmicutes) TaxID=1924098 RepID=UPI003F993746
MILNKMYFSATGTSKKVIDEIGDRLLKNIDILKGDTIDFTSPSIREKAISFFEDDIVLVGIPVYAGRVPNVLLKYLNSIKGKSSKAIPVVLYGNRNYDDALLELNDILIDNGFDVIAAGSFIGEHSFSYTLAKDRPDTSDLSIARDFADAIYSKIKNNIDKELNIKGSRPYRKYYIPKDKEKKPVDIRKVTPKTDENCIDCKICSEVCPMGSIDYEDVRVLNNICIKCGACIKKCPRNSKYFDDQGYLRHKRELEEEFKKRREPELFI